MKKIVRGNDFTLRVPVMKIVDGAKVAFPLPGCTDIKVNIVNQYRRIALSYTIDVSEDNVLLARVEGDKVAVGTYALEVKGKIFGNDWRSNEYEQFQIVDNNAAGDTAFEPQEGEDSVEMDTATVILAPSVELSDLIDKANQAVKTAEATNTTLNANEDARKEAETQRVNAESERVKAEHERFLNELGREEAERTRTKAESDRVIAERTRVEDDYIRHENEFIRKNNETKRVAAEQERVKVEEARVSAEGSRANAETERVSAETQRASTEDERVKAETGRASAEAERVKAEKKRQTDTDTAIQDLNTHRTEFDDAEAARVKAENGRVEAEKTRQQAETDRASAESERVDAEGNRVSAETKRKSDFDAAIKASKSATAGAEKVNATITDANVLEVTGRDGVKKSLPLVEQAEAATIKTELAGKFDKANVAQELGEAEDKVVSQKVVSDKLKKLETKVEGNSIVVDSIVGGDKNIKSVYDLKYTNAVTPLTVLEGYASEEYTGTTPYKNFRTNIPIGSGFPTSGTYHVYGKFEIHVEGNNVSNLKSVGSAIISANAVIEPAITEFPVNKLQAVYLGKITFTGTLTNYFYLLQSNIKNLQGNNVGGTYTVSYRYYGGYLVDAATLGVADPNDLTDKLDYTKDETVINLPGTNNKVNADLKSLHAEDAAIKENVEGIRSNVESLNTLTAIVKSAVDVRKDKFAVDASSSDEGDFIRKSLSAPYYYGRIAVKEYFASTKGKYSCFAKIKLSTEDSYDTSDKFASVFVSRNRNESSNYKVYNVPLNKLTGVYLGDIDDPGTISYFYVDVSSIRDVNGNPVTSLGAITWDFYGAYYVKESEVSGIKEHIADYIDYSKLETPVLVNSVYSNRAEQADKAKQADFAASSELANNVNNIFRGIQLKVYGDSLVVFMAWDNLKKMLSIKGSVKAGIGGIEVRNNSTSINYGLCSLEKIAAFPRNMKLLVIYGGANDGVSTKWAEATPDHPMTVDINKLGTISDEPLKIADMLNYRVTKENISNTNTLGRAQTFYQGYKTMLRNVMALFPNCFILCVTQHKYYYYDKPTGGFSDTPVIRMGAYEKVKAIREIAEEYSVPVCDLWATSGVNDHNRRYTLIDAAGVLVHQTTATALREESLILNKILEIAPKFEIPNYSITKGEDIIEMKKWVVDVRDETECNDFGRSYYCL